MQPASSIVEDNAKRECITRGISDPPGRGESVSPIAEHAQRARGRFTPQVRSAARQVIERLPEQGFDAAALCCTELPVLLRGESFGLAVFDTVELHARAALDFALEGLA